MKQGKPVYAVWFKQKPVVLESALGIKFSDSSVFRQLTLSAVSPVIPVTDKYILYNAKRSHNTYSANKRVFTLSDYKKRNLQIIFQVSNDGLAFRYYLPGKAERDLQIEQELTTYNLDKSASGWLQPKAEAKTGFEHTNPSYEENYRQNIPVGTYSKTGWVYPSLFKMDDNWALITEADLDGSYCGTMLYNEKGSAVYHVSFPDSREEITGEGVLPKNVIYTPWRVITIGSLKTIVESTLGTDVAKPEVPVKDKSFVKLGKASWSWIMSKDDSINFTETKRYIDFAHKMNWQYCLIDAGWDTRIGYEKVKELADYAAKLHVGILLWYNSAGSWNTVKLTPKDKLLTQKSRAQEFERLKSMGIKGIKIDFFGGDGRSMIQYYIDILESALKYQLLVNFHGATLPRGWARTYPNLVSTEAVKGFEMITFSQGAANDEPNHAAMLPFTRNAFDPMDFTPMNLYKIPGRITRKTTQGFELATSILFLSGIQHYAESPAGMDHMPEFIVKFLQNLPDHWDDVHFIDGFPGKYAVIARKGKGKWYVAGINGEMEPKKITIDLSWTSSKSATLIYDGKDGAFKQEAVIIPPNKKLEIELKPNGGFTLVLQKSNK